MPLPTFDLSVIFGHLIHLALAYGLAFPLGWNSEKERRAAGLRTFPLVALASCGFILIGRTAFGGGDAVARVLYGLMTGIGFIGGGAILKQGKNVEGTATAASIWATGAIGAAVAFQFYEIALVLSGVTFATLKLSPPLKKRLNDD